ncbi:hypothetical protein SDC9_203113 [bioreactor metagenome]|uniref:Uncharacterized protein n=1 Tax=bioreactor metagenome TaxID=1076179 RepID=A0A645IVR7_9ZZZZ
MVSAGGADTQIFLKPLAGKILLAARTLLAVVGRFSGHAAGLKLVGGLSKQVGDVKLAHGFLPIHQFLFFNSSLFIFL